MDKSACLAAIALSLPGGLSFALNIKNLRERGFGFISQTLLRSHPFLLGDLHFGLWPGHRFYFLECGKVFVVVFFLFFRLPFWGLMLDALQ